MGSERFWRMFRDIVITFLVLLILWTYAIFAIAHGFPPELVCTRSDVTIKARKDGLVEKWESQTVCRLRRAR